MQIWIILSYETSYQLTLTLKQREIKFSDVTPYQNILLFQNVSK